MEPNEDPFSKLSQSEQDSQSQEQTNDPFAQLSQHFEDNPSETTGEDASQQITEDENSSEKDPFQSLVSDTGSSALQNLDLDAPTKSPTNVDRKDDSSPEIVTPNPFSSGQKTNIDDKNSSGIPIPNPFFSEQQQPTQNTGQGQTNFLSQNPISTGGGASPLNPQSTHNFQASPQQYTYDKTAESAKDLLESTIFSNEDKTEALKELLDDEKSSIAHLSEALFEKETRNKVEDESVRTEVHDKLIYLTAKLNQDIRFYEKKSGATNSWSLLFRLLSTALAAVVTVLLGINVSGVLADSTLFFGLGVQWLLNTLALLISAFLTVISDIRSFTDSDSLRVKFADTKYRLKQLKDVIEYLQLGGDYITLKEVNSIKLEYDRIIEETNDYVVESTLESEKQVMPKRR